jgi:hypothetical protein
MHRQKKSERLRSMLNVMRSTQHFCLILGNCNNDPQTGKPVNNRNLFLAALEAASPRSKNMVRAYLLVCRWPSQASLPSSVLLKGH